MDVTRDIRLAQEPTALPGVSLTGDVTNVIESELPSQGLSQSICMYLPLITKLEDSLKIFLKYQNYNNI
jgi:hypothetical protein